MEACCLTCKYCASGVEHSKSLMSDLNPVVIGCDVFERILTKLDGSLELLQSLCVRFDCSR